MCSWYSKTVLNQHRYRVAYRGFTIVELLIVIVVIAILAVITIVAYNGVQQQAKSSALKSEMSQLQRTIQVSALQNDGNSVSLEAPVAYLKTPGTSALASPLVSAQEVTLYVVFNTSNNLASSWGTIAHLTPHANANNGFAIRASEPDTDRVNGFYATTTSSNQSIHHTGIRNTTGRHVGWITAKVGTVESSIDNATPIVRSIPAHTGWNFTDVILYAQTGATGVAALVFPEYHTEAMRQQVLRWLDREYAIDYYT